MAGCAASLTLMKRRCAGRSDGARAARIAQISPAKERPLTQWNGGSIDRHGAALEVQVRAAVEQRELCRASHRILVPARRCIGVQGKVACQELKFKLLKRLLFQMMEVEKCRDFSFHLRKKEWLFGAMTILETGLNAKILTSCFRDMLVADTDYCRISSLNRSFYGYCLF